MGFFSAFKKNKGNENNEGNGNFLENYFNSRFKINTDNIKLCMAVIGRHLVWAMLGAKYICIMQVK